MIAPSLKTHLEMEGKKFPFTQANSYGILTKG